MSVFVRRSILHPKESSESFIGDSLKFIAVMLVSACYMGQGRRFVYTGMRSVRRVRPAVCCAAQNVPCACTLEMLYCLTRLESFPSLPAGCLHGHLHLGCGGSSQDGC